ncbi:MAG: MFS transporter [Bacteroidales bacterium]|nr:MAG: MFS transporter [Bacteroidales bacterium]
MKGRSKFPKVFWVANSIEVLERFAYYGIFMGFLMYMESLGFTRDQSGTVQGLFLFVSYFIPVFSGTFADRFGFKRVLIISYLAYVPSVLLLLIADSYSEIMLTMLSIGFAAGIFKPLISGTVRLTTDSTNKTLGFGIFYLMVNVGASFGPIMAGKLRAISWNYAFLMAGIATSIMFVVTLLFYKEPEKDVSKVSVGKKLAEIFSTLTDVKYAVFLILLGLFFWLPFWGFFNICPAYVDKHINTFQLYEGIESIFGGGFAQLLSRQDEGVWRINGEAIAHTGWIILILQYFISRIFEKRRALPSFGFGIFVAGAGFLLIGYSINTAPAVAILGIFIFAVGEMISSPRIQEYITWIAPKEKAGLYMGSNFLAICIGALLSGQYTKLFGFFESKDNPEFVWYVLGAHCFIGVIVFFMFVKIAGEFREMEK